MPYFHTGRCDYPNFEPRFRIQAMITHLQRDLGVCYHPGRIGPDDPFRSEDSFINGIIQGEGGNCSSLPVLYVAVGRRSGYPLVLANTRGHRFARWDALPGGDFFNIEASGEGIRIFLDDHFRTGKYEMPEEQIWACGYLRSQSPHVDGRLLTVLMLLRQSIMKF